jgi:predicted ATPase/class 3 adenylate cyclase
MTDMELPTGTVTFLFTDIEGSTRLLQELGRDRYGRLEAEHARLIREAVAHGDGRGIRSEGDSLFAVFSTPAGAVRAAVAAQRALAAHGWPDGRPLRVRMGMHTGEGHRAGHDYVGIDVNRAARIAAAGHGGQVLLSETTKALVERGLPDGVALRALGSHRLKDIAHPEHLHDLVIEGLPSDFPPLRTLEVPTNLPTEVTSFVGREGEVAELRRLLGEARLLTLTGPGGTGKTRLALRLAREVLPEFRDGVFFIDLSPIRDPAEVPSAIARSLGLKEDPGRTLSEVVMSSLSDREVLLVLDNFEQVLEAAPVVDDIRAASVRTTVVVTSRARLSLTGEREFSVPPLDPPGPRSSDPQELSRSGAVALFVDRARAARNGFLLTDGNASAVAEVCRRLEGLPLAIELAAAQVRLLTPGEIASRLDSHLGSLGSGPRNVPARQRTLRGAIDWSYELLASPERALFSRLAVFLGGASLEAIEAVCNPEEEVDADTLSAVGAVVDHSLLRRIDGPDGSRFIMLETIRRFAAERLEETADARVIRDRHARFYAAMAERAEPHLARADREVWLDRLERDYGNLRAALGWCIDADRADVAMRLVASVWRFWQLRGHIAEGRQLAAAALALGSAAEPTRVRARALLALGSLAYWQDDLAAARSPYEEDLELARLLGDREVVAEALFDLGYVEGIEGNFDVADRLFHESGKLKDALGDHLGGAWVTVGRAMILGRQGQWREIMNLLEEVLPTFEEAGDRFGIENTIGTMASAEYRLGNLDRAEERTRWVLRSAPSGLSSTAIGMAGMATLALARGDPARAMRLWGVFEAIKEDLGGGAPMVLLPLGDTREEAAARLDEGVAAALREEGRRMGPQEAVRYALGEDANESAQRLSPASQE